MKNSKGFVWFLIPSIALFLFTTVYPFLSGINIAFTNWDGISNTYEYVGFKNFVDMFHDTNIGKSIFVSVAFALGYTLLNNVLALFLAIILRKKFIGNGVFKTIFFIPMALSAVLAAFVWGFIDRNILSDIFGPSFTTCVTLTLTSSLREFGIPMSATGGGPARSSEMISIFIYNNLFSYQKAGYGQAVSLVFMIILMIIGVGLTRFFRSKEVEL